MAWLFNIRGSDISYNPVAFAGALLTQEDVILFIDERKLGADVMQVCRDTHEYDEDEEDVLYDVLYS